LYISKGILKMIDQKTVNREYPLPHADNKLREDVVRLNDAFVDIDTDVNDLYATTGTLSTEVMSLTEDTQNGSLLYADSTGDGTAYQVVLNPAATVLNAGLLIHMKAHVQNTGPATLNVNSLGIKAIKKTDGSDLKGGDIVSGSACFLFYDGTNFQLINPKMDQAQTELNTSNIMRAFEEIQENHGGSLLMEAGWSDSFSNSDEQGADESSSIGFQHDSTNTLYKGSDPGIGLNSDKNYDTESNYLQQEWTNINQSTSQASATNGSATVSISSGAWPANCIYARITFDSGINWYDIDVRDSVTQITLKTTYSGPTSSTLDYIIRMSNFDSSAIQLAGSLITGSELLDRDYHTKSIGHSLAWGRAVGSKQKVGLCFSVGTTGFLSRMDIVIWYIGSPSNWSAEIYPLTGGTNSVPDTTGPALASVTGLTTAGLTTVESNATVKTITFPTPASVVSGSFYACVLTQTNPSDSNHYYVGSANGEPHSSDYCNYNGSTWNPDSNTYQAQYEVYVTPQTATYVSSEHVSLCDTETQIINTAAWSDINSAAVTETLNSQKVYYWLMFDPAFSFGVGTEIKVFNSTNLVWRKIAKNDAGTWKYNNDATDTAAEDWVSSTVDDMLHAVSEAISTQAGNRMAGVNLTAITDTQWEESGGWSTSVNSIIRGLTLYSNSSTQNPSVLQYRLNYDSERGAMDLRSKTYDPGFVPAEGYVWSRIEHSDSDGPGTFYVSRNGGTEWTVAPITQQGSPLSGDIRIYRGTVDINGQTSGQDLRCRYETEQGKDQFLHSWGLQAKS
jgi:hypothetical protein